MSDGVMIPLDVDDTRAQRKVQKLKKDAREAGKGFGQAQAQAARLGGPAGGALGRSVGGFQQGTGAGLVGLGLTAVGMGLNAFLQRDAERVNLAREREQRTQAADARARTVLERREASAAGGMQFMDLGRRLIAKGVDRNAIASTIRSGRAFGLNAKDSLMAAEVSEKTGVSYFELQKGMATGLLGGDASSVAATMQKFGGLTNALMATQGVGRDEALQMQGRILSDPRGKNLASAGSAMTPVEQRMLDDLMGGETARVMTAKANDELTPGARPAAEAGRAAMDTMNQLRAAADAQGTIAARLAEMGRVVGLSEGSAARKLANGAQAAQE
jgi:hypothetical protein